MAELSIGGEAFHVEIEGDEGAPVLMLSNAIGTTLHLWDPLMPAFLKHYRVLRYDARGHGDSVVSEGPYSIAGLGQDVLAILDTLGLERVDFLGLSLGGIVGQWLLTHAPRRIGKAVLADTAPQIAPPDAWNNRIQTVLQDGMGAISSAMIENWFTKDFRENHAEQVGLFEDMVLRTPPQGYAATCAAIRDVDLREAIRSIQAPVLVIVGRHDTTTPPGIAALMTSTIPKAKLVTLEASHLSNVEDAEQFSEKALEFLLAEEPVAEPETKAAAKPAKPRKPKVKKAAAVSPSLADIEAPETEVANKVPKAPARKPSKKVAVEPAPVEAPTLEDVAAPKRPAKKPAPPKAAIKKAAPKKAAAKAAPVKAPPKKRAVTKAVPKKAVAKKSALKKSPIKKTAAKKTSLKKTAAKKSVIKKTAAKKPAVKKTALKKTAVKKAVVKKILKKALPSRKTGPAKAARKPVKKAVAKKASRRR